jgi:hypothetical protein
VAVGSLEYLMRIYDEIDDRNIIVEEYFRKLLVRYLLGC